MHWHFWRWKQRDRDLEDEVAFDLAAEVEEQVRLGLPREEAERASRRDFGNVLLLKEDIRETWGWAWFERLAQDIRYGWRQLKKHRAVSAAAILSLALAVGATTVSFRLVDAFLLRALPIAQPERVFYVANTFIDRDGRPDYRDDFDYPTFRRYREAVADQADPMVVGMTSRQEAVFGSGTETEKFYRQYVSGNVFGVFGLRPATGRLLTPNDDLTPGAHPVAVLSYEYWSRRFARDPHIVGKTFRYNDALYQIVGVAPEGFIGTEPGIVTDIFIPAMMNARAIDSPGWSWFRIWVRPKIGVAPDRIREILQTLLTNEHRDHARSFRPDMPKSQVDAYLKESILLFPAAAGASETQKQYRRPLLILACLVALVLLVACANVGNLLTAQAAARAREMALRVSIGAGKGRLVQLVLVESALLAILASAVGTLFSWLAAPLVVSMLAPPEDPVRIVLGADWHTTLFGVALTAVIALSFGLAPALRASSVKLANALKGGEYPLARRSLMHGLIAGQMALCVLVLFVAGLFVTTFERLTNRPLGFSDRNVLAMDVGTGGKAELPDIWMQVASRLRETPGVESAAVSSWTFLSGNNWTASVRVPNRAAEPRSPYCLDVSAGFFETMRIELIDGRDFRPGDDPPLLIDGRKQPSAGVGIVNEAFARKYFDGRNPVGSLAYVRQGNDALAPMRIVGYVKNAVYSNVREPITPVVYVPITAKDGATLIIRTAGDSNALAPVLRLAVPQIRPEFRVRNIQFQSALVRRQMIRERLLAALSFFFAFVALLLAATGLYGVLNYSVIRQRHEIGIRMALGAPAGHVVGHVTTGILAMVCLGSIIGLAGGLASVRFVEMLLYEVKATDATMVAAPILTLFGAATLAALPPVIRAVKIDPAQTLRNE